MNHKYLISKKIQKHLPFRFLNLTKAILLDFLFIKFGVELALSDEIRM